MRIISGEMRKIFRAGFVLCIALTGAVFLVLAALDSVSALLPYTVSGSENMEFRWYYQNNEYMAMQYRTYKWFLGNFGSTVTDDTLSEMEKLTFPHMEKVISDGEAFHRLGVTDISEYDELLSKYTDFDEFRISPQFDIIIRKDGLYDSDYEWERMNYLLYWANDSFKAHRIDQAISESGVFSEHGISSYDEYMGVMNELPKDDELYSVFNMEFDGICRQPADTLDSDPVLDELWQFWLCRRVKYFYEIAHIDPLGIFKSDYGYSFGSSHTQREFAKSELTDGECIIDRAEQLGENKYTVRSPEIAAGFEKSAPMLVAVGIAASIVLSGLYGVRDNRDNMPGVLYSTRIGRRITKKKLLAVVISSALVSTIIAAEIAVLSFMDIFSEFYGLPINSALSFEYYWLDINMWQYIAIYIAFAYIICAGFSVVSFCVCSVFSGYIPAVTVCALLCTVSAYLYSDMLRWLFALPESFWQDILILAVTACTAVIGAVFRICRTRREKA